jgi:glycosyltransferase involved in cell wall biosynthesis
MMLALVVPCFNEEILIESTVRILDRFINDLIVLGHIKENSFVLFVNDGSTDQTLSIIKKTKTYRQKVITLTRNYGHQYALHAGLTYCTDKVDCVISLDADMQHDLSIIPEILNKFNDGYQMVFGIRNFSYKESKFKKLSSSIFYWIMNAMGVSLVKSHADFRLLSNRVLIELQKYSEKNLFLRGIFPLINLPSTNIYYNQVPRKLGTSKYNLPKMISLAVSGITSFSIVPIRIITVIGIILFFITLVMSIKVLVTYYNGNVVPGWASITLPLYFLGGVQLLSLGLIGEYIAKIYKETKNRPLYHILEVLE